MILSGEEVTIQQKDSSSIFSRLALPRAADEVSKIQDDSRCQLLLSFSVIALGRWWFRSIAGVDSMRTDLKVEITVVVPIERRATATYQTATLISISLHLQGTSQSQSDPLLDMSCHWGRKIHTSSTWKYHISMLLKKMTKHHVEVAT